MAHALHRILLSTAEAKKCLFAMVARNPQTDPQEGVYCHIFLLSSKEEVGRGRGGEGGFNAEDVL